jgi:hypothetical protein
MKIMMLSILWDFVNRKLLWNKWGDVRIENPSAKSSNLGKYQYPKRQSYLEIKVNGLLEKGKHCGLMIPIG